MTVYILQGWSYEDTVIDGIYKDLKDAKKRKSHVEKISNFYELSDSMSFDEVSEIVSKEAKELDVPEYYAEMQGWKIVEEEVK